MPLSRADLTVLLADLEASVEDLRADYVEEAYLVEAVASLGEDIADQAGPDRCWVEEQVAQLLARHDLLRQGVDPDEGEG